MSAVPGKTDDWLVVCVKTSASGAISHLGVDVPRGTQHVPVEEALRAMAERGSRFFVEIEGDLLLLRARGASLGTSRDRPGAEVLALLPDCGDGPRFAP